MTDLEKVHGKAKTNADVIREMTNEQLVEFIQSAGIGDLDYAITFCDLCQKDGGNALNLDCNGCLRHWLDSPATDVFGLAYSDGKDV